MSSTDQQTATRRPTADAEVPAEHEVPEDLALAAEFDAATRDQWRELVAGVLRKAGREDLPDPVEDALRRHRRHRRPRRAAVHRRGRRRPADRGRRPGPAAVRARRPGRCRSGERRARRLGRPPAARRTPTSPSRRRRSPPTWRTASPRCGWSLGEGAIPVDVARRRARRRPARPRAGDACRAGSPAAEAFLALVEGRTDLAPGGSLGLDPLGVQAASGRAAGPVRPRRRRPPRRRPRRPADGRRRRHRLRRRRGVGGRGARLLARRRGRLPAGAHRGRAERRRGVRASWSSATPRAPTSSRRSPGCGPPAGCGTGSARSAAPRPRRARQRQHAVTSSVMTTKRDPWVNLLRTTVACFAAGRGRRRRRHRAAVRRRARPARRVLPADRPQHPEPAGRGGAPRPRARPGRRLLVRRVAHRRPGPGRLGLVHRDRAGRRPGRGAGLRPGRATGSPPPGTRGRSGWRTARGRDHRRQRVPQPGREAARPREPAGRPPPVRRPAAGARRPGVRGAARRGRRRAPSRPTVYLATIGPIARHTARASFAGNLFQAGGLETPSGDGVDGLRRRGDDGRLHLRHRQGLRRATRPGWPRS